MDASIWALLMAKVKTHEAARDWVRTTATEMEVSAVRSPSLSRRIQSTIINLCAIALRDSTASSPAQSGPFEH